MKAKISTRVTFKVGTVPPGYAVRIAQRLQDLAVDATPDYGDSPTIYVADERTGQGQSTIMAEIELSQTKFYLLHHFDGPEQGSHPKNFADDTRAHAIKARKMFAPLPEKLAHLIELSRDMDALRPKPTRRAKKDDPK